jgi:hypothetical protein
LKVELTVRIKSFIQTVATNLPNLGDGTALPCCIVKTLQGFLGPSLVDLLEFSKKNRYRQAPGDNHNEHVLDCRHYALETWTSYLYHNQTNFRKWKPINFCDDLPRQAHNSIVVVGFHQSLLLMECI